MQIGLADAGRVGTFHASTLAALEDVEQIVPADALPGSAARVAEEHGYEFSPSLDDLLSRVDALVITTSTLGHAPALWAALAARMPVFCGKPPAVTLSETGEMVHLVEEAEVPVQVGFFAEGGDVDTSAALLTLDEGTLVTSTATRYNGCDEVAGRTATPCTVSDALEAFRIAEPCEVSQATGRAVEMDQIGGAT